LADEETLSPHKNKMEQVRRDEAFSRQAAPHLLEPSLSFPGYSASNRSRSYTGDDSTQSSSDNSSKDNKITDPKRRSHRPRGCRGGRKNRKTRNNSILLTVPKEIIGGNTPLSICENLRQSGSSKAEGDQKRERGIEYAVQRSWTEHSVPDENAFCTANFPPLHQTMQSASKENATNTMMSRPTLEQSSFLPPLGRANPMRTNGLPNSMHVEGILPPLCMPEVHAPNLDGPNPYALSYAKESPKPYDWTNNSKRSANAIQRPAQLNLGYSAETAIEYCSLRIEKQRQMLTDGGSLFATSPRSFLMGGNSCGLMSW
jgi:hypothetical protein